MLLLSQNVYDNMPTEVKKTKNMENPKQQLIERIKAANNVLVTVSANPTVDQLSAAIGLTLMLNKLGKHGTAVFSGQVPSTIEFLQPEKTLEKNTDSLRDFIIALDKTKADKLRYKVEDSHVKIFITPYRTSITEKDLDFSQGDFNVEVVVALGVTDQRDLDQAITAHGRILHDATTVSVNVGGEPSTLGSINWQETNTSSLSEMIASLASTLDPNGGLDAQIATALMTGIVAETQRFSNEKTSSTTMSLGAALMAAGANQQLVASQLEEKPKSDPEDPQAGNQDSKGPDAPKDGDLSTDGSLQIEHNNSESDTEDEQSSDEFTQSPVDQISIDENGQVELPEVESSDNAPQESQSVVEGGSSLILEPPTMGGKLTANSEPEALDPSTDPLGEQDNNSPLLTHQDNAANTPEEPASEPAQDAPELAGPSMDLPSELPEINSLPSPSEQSIQETEVPAPAESPAEEVPEQTLSDLEASIRESVQNEALPAEELTPPQFNLPVEENDGRDQPQASADRTNVAETDIGTARDQVSNALFDSSEQPLPPIAALNAQPLDLEIRQTGETGILNPDELTGATGIPEFTMPENLVPSTDIPSDNTGTNVSDPTAPPTVPPPFMPNMPGFDAGTTPEPPVQQPPANPQNPYNLPPA